jgi:HlyD family secretion protein
MEKEKINIKSDEITEILGTPPRWIVRWGITLLFAIILVIFIGSIFFRYPDTVIAPVVITAENPPSVVVARANGKPAALFVNDGKLVRRGDTLGVIESSANYIDVFYLSEQIRKTNLNDTVIPLFQSLNLRLGEVQPLYNAYSRAANDYQIFQDQQYHKQKIQALQREYNQYEVYRQQLKNQRDLVEKDIMITQKQFNRDSTLFLNGVIAAVDFEKSQATMLAKLQLHESAKLNLSNTAITMERLSQSIADTRLEFESERKKLFEEVANSYSQLVSALASWEKNYLLMASSTGKITFMSIWSDLQEVKSGDPLFAITPESMGEVQARLIIPFEGAGKVKPGQRVNIKLDGYSYMEFGMVEGIIQSISSGYNDTGYPALAELPNGPTTSYGIKIQFDKELQGTAEITTEDLSLLQRLFSPIKHLYKSRIE